MADRSLEQLILEEKKRVTREAAAGGLRSGGLLDLVRPTANAPANLRTAQPKPTIAQPAPASPAMTLSKAVQTLAASPARTGNTAPAPLPAAAASPATTLSKAVQTLSVAPINRGYAALAIAETAAVSPAATISKAAQTLAATPINKGYTVPAPAPQTSPATPPRGSGVAAEMGKTAMQGFTSRLGVMPLISGLVGLFSGGEPAAPPPLVKYAMPQSIQIAAANSRDGGSFQFADHGQDGTVRSYGDTGGGSDPVSGGSAPLWPTAEKSTGAGTVPQVVVNVQAMDSRSFLDRSQEIAQAVRDAMLNMHALNDVVSEL